MKRTGGSRRERDPPVRGGEWELDDFYRGKVTVDAIPVATGVRLDERVTIFRKQTTGGDQFVPDDFHSPADRLLFIIGLLFSIAIGFLDDPKLRPPGLGGL